MTKIHQNVLIIGGSKFIANLFGEKLLDIGLRSYFPFVFFPLFIYMNFLFKKCFPNLSYLVIIIYFIFTFRLEQKITIINHFNLSNVFEHILWGKLT